jgi:hypothetical protein
MGRKRLNNGKDSRMPIISTFYGIINQMYWPDHAPPNFDANYAEDEVVIDIRWSAW